MKLGHHMEKLIENLLLDVESDNVVTMCHIEAIYDSGSVMIKISIENKTRMTYSPKFGEHVPVFTKNIGDKEQEHKFLKKNLGNRNRNRNMCY